MSSADAVTVQLSGTSIGEQERMASPEALVGGAILPSSPASNTTKPAKARKMKKDNAATAAILQEVAASFHTSEYSAAGERRYGADDYEDFDEDEEDDDEKFEEEYERGGWTAPSFAAALAGDAEGDEDDEEEDDEDDAAYGGASIRPAASSSSAAASRPKGGAASTTATASVGAAGAKKATGSSAAASSSSSVVPAIGKDGGAGSGANRQPVSLKDIHAQPKEHVLDRYRERINLNILEAKTATGTIKHTGRDDRATVEQVLDPRTRLILFKLLSQNVISEVHGCVSTGKEANVYHAFRPDGSEVAIKIYKTSILVFKDRDRYVTGEYRFASGYSRSNPRKMVKLWAEKETRNLKRLNGAGLPTPAPLMLRLHVLLMDFVGHNGLAAPRLKDARLNEEEAARAYLEVCDCIRAMFQRCRLVHADLSEYNLLWHRSTNNTSSTSSTSTSTAGAAKGEGSNDGEGHVVVIDVSQSVEREHPRALEFLRMDCNNITDFFRRLGVPLLLTPRELFDYVVHPGLATPEDEQQYFATVLRNSLDKQKQAAAAASSAGAGGAASSAAAEEAARKTAAEEEVEHAVFMQAFIPKSLSEVRDAEAETAKVARGDTSGLYHATMTGLNATTTMNTAPSSSSGGGGTGGGFAVKLGTAAGGGVAKLVKRPAAHDDSDDDDSGANLSTDSEEDDDESDEDDSDDDDDEEEEGGEAREKTEDGAYVRRGQTKEEKRAHKAAVKEEKRAKRATKIPKHVKKRHAKAKGK